MVHALLALVVLAVAFYIVFWIVGQMQLKDPARTVVLIVAGIICLLVLLDWLGVGGISLGRL